MTTLSFDDVRTFEIHDSEKLLSGKWRRVIEFTDGGGHTLRLNLNADSMLRLVAVFDADNDRPGDNNAA